MSKVSVFVYIDSLSYSCLKLKAGSHQAGDDLPTFITTLPLGKISA